MAMPPLRSASRARFAVTACPCWEVLVLTAVWRCRYKIVPAGRVGAPVRALGALAEAPARGKSKIMVRSAKAPGPGNHIALVFLAHLAEPLGIAMPCPPDATEKSFINVLGSSPQAEELFRFDFSTRRWVAYPAALFALLPPRHRPLLRLFIFSQAIYESAGR